LEKTHPREIWVRFLSLLSQGRRKKKNKGARSPNAPDRAAAHLPRPLLSFSFILAIEWVMEGSGRRESLRVCARARALASRGEWRATLVCFRSLAGYKGCVVLVELRLILYIVCGACGWRKRFCGACATFGGGGEVLRAQGAKPSSRRCGFCEQGRPRRAPKIHRSPRNRPSPRRSCTTLVKLARISARGAQRLQLLGVHARPPARKGCNSPERVNTCKAATSSKAMVV
jgi:hypothetical protein